MFSESSECCFSNILTRGKRMLYLKAIHKSVLFKKVPEDDLASLLEQLDSQLKHYAGDQVIFSAGRKVRRAGVLLEGEAMLVEEDFWGRCKELDRLKAGRILLASDAAAGTNALYTVKASKPCVILWFDVREILKLDSSRSGNTALLRSFMKELAVKNRELYARISDMDRTSTKEKLLSYLSKEAYRHNSDEFDIPFDRRQLAEYLCVERSAMSAELSRLVSSGYLVTRKNHFRLLKRA